jgi:hypothetical protein
MPRLLRTFLTWSVPVSRCRAACRRRRCRHWHAAAVQAWPGAPAGMAPSVLLRSLVGPAAGRRTGAHLVRTKAVTKPTRRNFEAGRHVSTTAIPSHTRAPTRSRCSTRRGGFAHTATRTGTPGFHDARARPLMSRMRALAGCCRWGALDVTCGGDHAAEATASVAAASP